MHSRMCFSRMEMDQLTNHLKMDKINKPIKLKRISSFVELV